MVAEYEGERWRTGHSQNLRQHSIIIISTLVMRVMILHHLHVEHTIHHLRYRAYPPRSVTPLPHSRPEGAKDSETTTGIRAIIHGTRSAFHLNFE